MVPPRAGREVLMKVKASLRSAKLRDKNCQIVRRKGKLYVINKRVWRL